MAGLLLQDIYNLEIAGGLGPTAGKIWRVGIMGYNANTAAVALVLEAFRDGLAKQGKLDVKPWACTFVRCCYKPPSSAMRVSEILQNDQ